MNTTKIKRNNEGIRRKRENEGINRRKGTLIKKAYELGEFDGMDVALIICKHGRYTTYRSRDHKAWPPSIAEIVSARSIEHWYSVEGGEAEQAAIPHFSLLTTTRFRGNRNPSYIFNVTKWRNCAETLLCTRIVTAQKEKEPSQFFK